VTIAKARKSPQPLLTSRRYVPPVGVSEKKMSLSLNHPIPPSDHSSTERFYALKLVLEPGQEYLISGGIQDGKKSNQIFAFTFRADSRGMPLAN
jgi:hypothetical protein